MPFTFATVGFGYVPDRSPPAVPVGAPEMVTVFAAVAPLATTPEPTKSMDVAAVARGVPSSLMTSAEPPDPPAQKPYHVVPPSRVMRMRNDVVESVVT